MYGQVHSSYLNIEFDAKNRKKSDESEIHVSNADEVNKASGVGVAHGTSACLANRSTNRFSQIANRENMN